MRILNNLFDDFSGRSASVQLLLSSSSSIINYIKNKKNHIFEELEFEEKLNIIAILFSQSRLDDNIDNIKYIISENSETPSKKKYSSYDIELHGDPEDYGNIYNRNEVLIDHLFLECFLNSANYPNSKVSLFNGILKIPEDKLNRIRVKDLLTELIFIYSKKWLKIYYDKKLDDLSYPPGKVSLELISKFLISRVDSEGFADKRGFNMNEEDCNKILMKEINFKTDSLPTPYKQTFYNKIFLTNSENFS